MDVSGQQVQDHIHDFFHSSAWESRSIDDGGEFMNSQNNLGSCKRFAWIAVLTGVMVTTFSLPAFGQQEVDPTWYDPWVPKTVEVHAVQPAAVQHRVTVKQVSYSRHAAKVSGKRSAKQAKSQTS
jgi:hypothetical protein